MQGIIWCLKKQGQKLSIRTHFKVVIRSENFEVKKPLHSIKVVFCELKKNLHFHNISIYLINE